VAGYPFVPALYIFGAAVVVVMLFVYRPATTWPGLAIVIVGAGVYAVLPRAGRKQEKP
jgi:APA family basic amino acid/polyamine antiporter